MSSPTIVLDGQMAFGTPNSGLININGTAYILENINVDRGETVAGSKDGKGRPNRERITADVATLTADLQLATETTPYPVFGSVFSLQVDGNFGTENWKVLPQNYVATNGEGDIRIAPLRARIVLNQGQVTPYTG